MTAAVLNAQLEPERWTLSEWLAQRFRGGLNRLAPLINLPLGPLRKIRPQAWEDARSCNLAVWRSDLDRVDGFDASFSGWGKEDSDLLVRLLHAAHNYLTIRRNWSSCCNRAVSAPNVGCLLSMRSTTNQ